MEDLRTILRIIARRKVAALATIMLAGAIAFFAGGAELEFVSVPPVTPAGEVLPIPSGKPAAPREQ